MCAIIHLLVNMKVQKYFAYFDPFSGEVESIHAFFLAAATVYMMGNLIA